MPDLELFYGLKLQGRWHFGSGLERGSLDRANLRDGRGLPYIPGSHVKGKIREQCEWLCRLLELPVFDPHSLDEKSAQRFGIEARPGNPVERLFGTRYRGGTLTVSHAAATGPEAVRLRDSRGGSLPLRRVSMNRGLGRARDQRLFSAEYGFGFPPDDEQTTDSARQRPPAPASITFRGRILVRHSPGQLSELHKPFLREWQPGWPLEWSLLTASFQALHCLGGDRSSGAGACEAILYRARWRGKEKKEWSEIDPPSRLLATLELPRWIRLFRMAETPAENGGSRLSRFLDFAREELGLSPDSSNEDWSEALELFDEDEPETQP